MNWKVFEQALIDYDRKEVNRLLQSAVAEGQDIDFIEDYIVKALNDIGDKWERGEVALSQVYMSSKLCEEIVNQLLLDSHATSQKAEKIAIMTLEDYHTLGKRIVSSVVKSSGYELIDLGTQTDLQNLATALDRCRPNVLIVSVLMFHSALRVEKLMAFIKSYDPQIKVIVGGAPFMMDLNLWSAVGADAMGKSASDTVRQLNEWSKEGFE